MSLSEKISALRESAEGQLDVLNSKEKTKNALLLPFFNALGYDAFNVREVEPGHAVELGEEVRNVDYAVKIDGAPAMLFQCEEAATDLDAFNGDPLFRHLGVLDTGLVVLTNGRTYRFFADLGGGGAVDGRPFLEFDLLDYEAEQITFLKLLTKSAFDTDEVLSAAYERKYTRLLQNYLVRQREDLDAHFLRFLAAQIHEGEVSEEILDRFQPVVQKLLRQFDMEKRKIQRQATGKGEEVEESTATSHSGETEQSTETSPSKDSGQPEKSSVPDEEQAGTEAPTQELSSKQSENGKEREVTGPPDGVTESEESVRAEHKDGAPDDDESDGDPDDDELEGGTNIAEEFANKVVGNS
jgi:hypothetical protein